MSETKGLSTGEAITMVTTAGASGWAVWEKIIKPFVGKSKAQRKEMYDMIASIHGELKYNGGSSIKDAVLRLERGQEKIITRLYDIEESQKISLNLQGQLFWTTDATGICDYVSPSLCRSFGYSETDMLGNNWYNIISHGDKKRIFDAWDFAVKNKVVFDETYTIKNGDGLFQKVLDIRFHKSAGGTLGKIELIDKPFK